MAGPELSAARVDEVVAALGFDARPSPDRAGLDAVYAAWCGRVPFDNLRKLVALRHDMPELPGIEPADFFAAWQLTGAGGTCWPSNNGLHSLLVGLGFDARLHGASMLDLDGINHGTTVVHLDGRRVLVDTAMLSGAPLPLDDGQVATTDHAGWVVSAEPDPGGWIIRFPTPDPGSRMVCRLRDEIDYAATAVAYEETRVFSVFNDVISCHAADEDGVWLVRGDQVARIDREGTSVRQLGANEVDRLLIDEVGHAPALVAEVRAALAEDDGPEGSGP